MSEPAEEEHLACQIGSWYPLFPKSKTFRTVILNDLPDPDFINYLNADQVILPRGVKTSSALLEHRTASTSFDDEDDEIGANFDPLDLDKSDEEVDEEAEGDESTRAMMHEMHVFSQRIEKVIQVLGGAVLPKLNWSSPKDAIWINGGTMECRRGGDVLLLLKSSDFISHDLMLLHQQQQKQRQQNGPQQQPSPIVPALCLRKWANLHPSQEFRCFCRERELVGICQRHSADYWPHLSQNEHQTTMKRLIDDFFHSVILASRFSLSSFVFDVYVDRKHRVWLVDLNVWGTRTDALLFDWEELIDKKNSILEFRVVEHPVIVQAHPLSNYKAPVDVLDLASENSRSFRDFMSLCERPSDRTDD